MQSAKLLGEFMDHCRAHPSERFWQALRNWSGAAFILARDELGDTRDTFYWSGRTQQTDNVDT